MADDIVTRCPECNEFGMRYMGRVTNDGDGPWVKCHHLITPDEWAPPPPDGPHDHKGYSEEKCVRCGWVMGMTALNCMNDDTPHRFPSQETEVARLLRWKQEACEVIARWDALYVDLPDRGGIGMLKSDAVAAEIERLRAQLRTFVRWGEWLTVEGLCSHSDTEPCTRTDHVQHPMFVRWEARRG